MMFRVDELRQICRGCLQVREEENGVYFDRLTETLHGFYHRANVASPEGFEALARSPAGVRLRFRSDATRVRIALRYGMFSRERFGVDLFVDDHYSGTHGPERWVGSTWSCVIYESDRRRNHDFDIWLPYGAETWLVSLEIEGESGWTTAPAPARRWLAIGDSITQGMDASRPSNTYGSLVSRSLSVEQYNTAVGGAGITAEAMQAVANVDWPTHDTDVCTIALGIGNWAKSRPRDELYTGVRNLVSSLIDREPDLLFLVLTPLPVFGLPSLNELGLRLTDYRETLHRAVEDFANIRIVDGESLIDEDTRYFEDGVHPNDQGMVQIAERLTQHLSALL